MMKGDTKVNETSSTNRKWRTKLKSYYLVNNLLTILIVLLLLKFMYKFNNSTITTSLLFVGSVYACLTVVSFVLILSNLGGSTTGKYEAIEYVKNIPLCYVTFYYFTKINYVKSADVFEYNFLLISTMYVSLQSIVNLILLQFGSSCVRFVSFFFLFLFRYFFFLAKMFSAVLFLSTFDDASFINFIAHDSTTNSVESLICKKVYTLCGFYALIAYLAYSVWYLAKYKRESNLFRIGFEAYKIFVDFNEAFFVNSRSFLLVLYMAFTFIVHVVLAYFWYFRAILYYTTARAKITLISLVASRLNNSMLVENLLELEEKLKNRQFELVCVMGSMVVCFLAEFIYYAYYPMDISQQEQKKVCIVDEAPKVDDGFSVNSYKHSSSVFSSSSFTRSTSSSSSSEDDNHTDEYMQYVKKHQDQRRKSMECSTCGDASTMDKYVFDSDMFTGASSSLYSFAAGDKIFRLDYETSSGVISSETTSSMSSIYNDFNYYCERTETFTTTNWSDLMLKKNSAAAVVNISHTSGRVQLSKYDEKVLNWFRNKNYQDRNDQMAATTSDTLTSQSQSTLYSSTFPTNSNFLSSFVNTTDSTTDKSEFTYFI